jgi:peroxiredoxin
LVGISLILVVGLVAAVSAFTGGKSPKGSSTPKSRLVGHRIRDFSLGGLNGGTIRAPWEANQSSVLVFFASYCGPCQGEMPKIADYIRTHDPSPVVVLAIDAIDVRTSAQAMVKKDGVTFPVAFDPNGAVTNNDFGFGQIPESVFISSRGIVEKVYYGAIPAQVLARGIAALTASHQ